MNDWRGMLRDKDNEVADITPWDEVEDEEDKVDVAMAIVMEFLKSKKETDQIRLEPPIVLESIFQGTTIVQIDWASIAPETTSIIIADLMEHVIAGLKNRNYDAQLVYRHYERIGLWEK